MFHTFSYAFCISVSTRKRVSSATRPPNLSNICHSVTGLLFLRECRTLFFSCAYMHSGSFMSQCSVASYHWSIAPRRSCSDRPVAFSSTVSSAYSRCARSWYPNVAPSEYSGNMGMIPRTRSSSTMSDQVLRGVPPALSPFPATLLPLWSPTCACVSTAASAMSESVCVSSAPSASSVFGSTAGAARACSRGCAVSFSRAAASASRSDMLLSVVEATPTVVSNGVACSSSVVTAASLPACAAGTPVCPVSPSSIPWPPFRDPVPCANSSADSSTASAAVTARCAFATGSADDTASALNVQMPSPATATNSSAGGAACLCGCSLSRPPLPLGSSPGSTCGTGPPPVSGTLIFEPGSGILRQRM